jgi:hypothetical protein
MPTKKRAVLIWSGGLPYSQYFENEEWENIQANPNTTIVSYEDVEFESNGSNEEIGQTNVLEGQTSDVTFTDTFEAVPDVYFEPIEIGKIEVTNLSQQGMTLGITTTILDVATYVGGVINWIAKS